SFAASTPPAVPEDAGAQAILNWATFNPGGGGDEATQTPKYLITNVSNPALFVVGLDIDASGKLTYTPALNANGACTLRLAVMDNGGTANGGVDTSATQTFTITVLSPKQQAQNLITQLAAMNLSAGNLNALSSKLDLQGNGGDAGKVSAFISQVRAF